MNLVKHQRELSQLVKCGSTGFQSNDPYIQAVATSPQLEMVREVVLWWRAYDIERNCVLTAPLLKRRGLLQEAIKDFVARPGYSPFISEMTQSFLRLMTTHSDSLISSMAQFELAVIAAKRGEPGEQAIEWPCDPRPVLNGVVPETLDVGPRFRTIVSRDIPGLVRLAPLEGAGK